MKPFTFRMTRTYETIIEIDADNYNDAFDKLMKTDVYAIELEQCCVIQSDIICEGEKYARKCSKTGEAMNEGWCFGDGQDYAKYEDGAIELAKEYGYSSLADAYVHDGGYWTCWEDEDDYQYQMINGELIEIQ